MVNIVIRGGNGEAAAREISMAVAEVFGEQPARLPATPSKPAVRGFIEAALIVLALPPALIGSADILSRARLRERLSTLITKTDGVSKRTKSSVMVDPGDGKHIPLEEASREAILAALAAMEQKLKGQVPESPEALIPQEPTRSRDVVP